MKYVRPQIYVCYINQKKKKSFPQFNRLTGNSTLAIGVNECEWMDDGWMAHCSSYFIQYNIVLFFMCELELVCEI